MDTQPVTVTLTASQVGDILMRGTTGAMTPLAVLLEGIAGSGGRAAALLARSEDMTYSRSTLRAVLLLSCMPADGSAIELAELARRFDANPSTTHRYLKTWSALGLVQQDPTSRHYRRVLHRPDPPPSLPAGLPGNGPSRGF